MKLEFIKALTESAALGGRVGGIPHPEETVLISSADAVKSFQELLSVIKNPSSLTIKWDGSVALVFGRMPNGKLTVMDKYMYDRKAADQATPDPFFAQSVDDYKKWDLNKASGKTREDLWNKADVLFKTLGDVVGDTPGLFWGDLMWCAPSTPLETDEQGKLAFGNNKVKYKVLPNTHLYNKCVGRVAGIAVHNYTPAAGKPFQQWRGNPPLNTTKAVTILSPTEGKQQGFTLATPQKEIKTVQTTLNATNCKLIDDILKDIKVMPGTVSLTLLKYLNSVAKGQTTDDVYTWLATNISKKQYQALVLGDDPEEPNGFLYQKAQGWQAIQTAFLALTNFKNALANNLENQMPPELEQYVGGKREGEGFVFNIPGAGGGLRKIVNKAGFTAAKR